MKLNKKRTFSAILAVGVVAIGMLSAHATDKGAEPTAICNHILDRFPVSYKFTSMGNTRHSVDEFGYDLCRLGCGYQKEYSRTYTEAHTLPCALCK